MFEMDSGSINVTGLGAKTSFCRRRRVARGTAISRFVDGGNTEQEIVFRNLADGIAGDVSDRKRVLPERRRGIAPKDLVAGEIRLAIRLPMQRCIIGQFVRLNLNRVRRGWSEG